MSKVVCEKRYPNLKGDGERVIRAMQDDGTIDESVSVQTILRYVSLGKRCEKHLETLMKWEAFHQRDSLIDNISTTRHIFRVSASA